MNRKQPRISKTAKVADWETSQYRSFQTKSTVVAAAPASPATGDSSPGGDTTTLLLAKKLVALDNVITFYVHSIAIRSKERRERAQAIEELRQLKERRAKLLRDFGDLLGTADAYSELIANAGPEYRPPKPGETPPPPGEVLSEQVTPADAPVPQERLVPLVPRARKRGTWWAGPTTPASTCPWRLPSTTGCARTSSTSRRAKAGGASTVPRRSLPSD